MRITINARRVISFDPSIILFHVVIEQDNRSWYETFGSQNELAQWIQGVRTGYIMATGAYMPELLLPVNTNPIGQPLVLVSSDDEGPLAPPPSDVEQALEHG